MNRKMLWLRLPGLNCTTGVLGATNHKMLLVHNSL